MGIPLRFSSTKVYSGFGVGFRAEVRVRFTALLRGEGFQNKFTVRVSPIAPFEDKMLKRPACVRCLVNLLVLYLEFV